MSIQEQIAKYIKDYKDRDILMDSATRFGKMGDLTDSKEPVDNIKKWLNLFIDIDKRKFTGRSIEEIKRLYASFNDLSRRLEKEYKGGLEEKNRYHEAILNLEEMVLNTLPKYESKINQTNLNDQVKIKEEIEKSTKEIKESTETIKESVELAQAKVFGSKAAGDFSLVARDSKRNASWWLFSLTVLSLFAIILTCVLVKPRESCLVTNDKVEVLGLEIERNISDIKNKQNCWISNNLEFYLPVYIILATLITLSYVSHKENRKKYYYNRQNAIIFNGLDNFLANKEPGERFRIIDIAFSRLVEEKEGTKISSSDVVSLAKDVMSRYKGS